MAVFISYSQENKDFVDKLANHLVLERVHIWLDRWELKVGDSLVSRIQSAISESDYLCVVLSRAAVASEWCKKELNAGLIRELDAKHVVILPVLMEDCDIPIFLRDKVYADFRSSFSTGFSGLIAALAHLANLNQGRYDSGQFNTDFGLDWGLYNDHFFFIRIQMVHIYKDLPFTLLAEIRITCDDAATRRNLYYEERGFGWFHRETLLEILCSIPEIKDLRLLIRNNFPEEAEFTFLDERTGEKVMFHLSVRRLGIDPGTDTLYDFAEAISQIANDRDRRKENITPGEYAQILKLANSYPHGV